MTQQTVSSYFPYLPIHIYLGGTITYEVEALLDTGFDGAVLLPSTFLLNAIPDIEQDTYELAHGSEVTVPSYPVAIEIDGFDPIEVSASPLGDEPIIGVEVIRHFSVILDHGRRVIVEP